MTPSKKNAVTLGIVILNVVIFLIDWWEIPILGNGTTLLEAGVGDPSAIAGGSFYLLLTCCFLHFGTQHLINNMLLLYLMGSVLESEIGKIRYITLYLGGGLISSYISYRYYIFTGQNVYFAGASGAIFALIGAVLFLAIWNHGRFASYSARQVFMYAVFSFIYGFTTEGIGNAAHISGLVVGFFISALLCRNVRNSKRVVV